MTFHNINNKEAATELDGGITSGALALDVADDATTIEAPAVPFVIQIGAELLVVTDTGSGTDWTVTRGFGDSTAVAHDDEDAVAVKIPAEWFTEAKAILEAVDGIGKGAMVRLESNVTVDDATNTTIDFDAADWDDDDFWEGVTNPSRITIPEDGRYLFTVNAVFETDSGDRIIWWVRDGGSDKLGTFSWNASNSGWDRFGAAFTVDAEAGDYFELHIYSTGTGGGDVELHGDGTAGDDVETTRVQVTRIK